MKNYIWLAAAVLVLVAMVASRVSLGMLIEDESPERLGALGLTLCWV